MYTRASAGARASERVSAYSMCVRQKHHTKLTCYRTISYFGVYLLICANANAKLKRQSMCVWQRTTERERERAIVG